MPAPLPDDDGAADQPLSLVGFVPAPFRGLPDPARDLKPLRTGRAVPGPGASINVKARASINQGETAGGEGAPGLPYHRGRLEAPMRTALPFLFALITAVAWGLYGPTLGQARLADVAASPFKPYLGIGIAYLVVAIVGGLVGMWFRGDSFSLAGGGGLAWGFAAGLLGAVGAFGLTLSMFSGGARIPHAIMPVVFGGAVTITAVSSLLLAGGRLRGGPLLWLGIAGMLLSTVLITTNTPHAAPPTGRSAESSPH